MDETPGYTTSRCRLYCGWQVQYPQELNDAAMAERVEHERMHLVIDGVQRAPLPDPNRLTRKP